MVPFPGAEENKQAADNAPLQSNHSIAVDEIGKRALHSIEHAPRLFLGALEGVLDARLGGANDSAFVRVAATFPCFHILHARTGKHSFCTRDCAATRAAIDRPDRM